MAPRTLAPHVTGALFLLASFALLTSAIRGAAPALETIGLALLGSAVAALGDVRLRDRRLGPILLVLVLVVIGDRLAEHAVAVGHTWSLPLAFGAYLLSTALTGTPRTVITALAPAMVGVALPLALRVDATSATTPMTMSLALLPIALLCGLIATARVRSDRSRTALRQEHTDLESVLMANHELRNVSEAQEAGHRIARTAAELLDADGAIIWLQGPGRLLCAGAFGVAAPLDSDPTSRATVQEVLLTGVIVSGGDELVLPLTASGGVFGAVSVIRPRRSAETVVGSLLQLFGAQAGYVLERLRTIEQLIDDRFVDPITGVGNRLAATASLATLRPNDAVMLLAVDSLATLRAIEGDAHADLVLGQLGLHLRTATRAGDVVARFGDDMFFVLLRDLATNAEPVLSRILASWQKHGSAGPLRAGAALHFADSMPLETLDRAKEALEAARNDRRPPITVAAERALWGPA